MRERESEPGVIAWIPGGRATNRRADNLRKIFAQLGVTADPVEILEQMWIDLTSSDGPWGPTLVPTSDSRKGITFTLNHERLEFGLASADCPPLQCPKCRSIWWRSVRGVCPSWRCDGRLNEIKDLSTIETNHYARLYQELEPIGMSVEEHTAQWKPDEASRIQDEFVRGKINVLSCSTTFEMGVDVGDVQAVMMRNVPPRASNYVQRAGRAGRRHNSAALVVTMAQLRSHDRAYFADPLPMINGHINPPSIHLDNTPILRRHAHSVAFAAFQRHMDDAGANPAGSVGEFFGRNEESDRGADQLRSWLEGKPRAVREALQRIMPPSVADDMKIAEWGWVEALYNRNKSEPTFGWMTRAVEEVDNDFSTLDEMIEEAYEARQGRRGDHLSSVKRGLERRALLGFLASRNVLPKYGFPIDVVELDLRDAGPKASNLELNRDLRMAISEYAPGAEVVAGGELWKAEGIRQAHSGVQLPKYHWKVCRDCGAFRSRIEEPSPICEVCDSQETEDQGRFITPRYGFIGSHAGEPNKRPSKRGGLYTWFGSYRDTPPDFADIPELSSVLTVQARASTQGRIVTINQGRYKFCGRCGRGELAQPTSGRDRRNKEHDDLRRPGKKCSGTMAFAQLGHDYLTDVLEIRVEGTLRSRYRDEAMRSVLNAILAGVNSLGIARDDVDGTMHSAGRDLPQALVIFDAVPGGAGYSQRILTRLPELFSAALKVASSCDCEETSSCYGCLRNYRNQFFHDSLSRGDAKALLEHMLAVEESDDFDLFSPLVHALLKKVIHLGAPIPVSGFETPDGHVLEAAWPEERIAVLLDSDENRDLRLIEDGWLAFHTHDWVPEQLHAAVVERATH